jgi:hypothetical protein
VADDLPDDLAVLSQLQMPPLGSGAAAEAGAGGEADGVGGDGEEATQVSLAQFLAGDALDDGASGPDYRVSFSELYRQLLLTCY